MGVIFILLIVIGIILILLALSLIVIHNYLLILNLRVDNQWSQIDILLKRRHDLIPQLVSMVRSYKKYEKSLLTDITKQRSVLMTGSISEKAKASEKISDSIKTIFAVAESYPKLQASKNYLSLQKELSDTETKLADTRMFYNDIATRMNMAVQVFPTNIIARLFSFKQRQLFKAEESEKAQSKVRV